MILLLCSLVILLFGSISSGGFSEPKQFKKPQTLKIIEHNTRDRAKHRRASQQALNIARFKFLKGKCMSWDRKPHRRFGESYPCSEGSVQRCSGSAGTA